MICVVRLVILAALPGTRGRIASFTLEPSEMRACRRQPFAIRKSMRLTESVIIAARIREATNTEIAKSSDSHMCRIYNFTSSVATFIYLTSWIGVLYGILKAEI